MIEVYPVGSEVLLDNDISARVTAIVIREGGVSYEVVWWNERSREQEEVQAWEVRPDGESAKTVRVNPIL